MRALGGRRVMEVVLGGFYLRHLVLGDRMSRQMEVTLFMVKLQAILLVGR